MNIRPSAGNLIDLAVMSIPQLGPVSQEPFLATGMFVPTLTRRGLGQPRN